MSTCTTALAGALPSRAAMPTAKQEAPELEVPLGESCDRHTARPGEALASTRVSKDTASRTQCVRLGGATSRPRPSAPCLGEGPV